MTGHISIFWSAEPRYLSARVVDAQVEYMEDDKNKNGVVNSAFLVLEGNLVPAYWNNEVAPNPSAAIYLQTEIILDHLGYTIWTGDLKDINNKDDLLCFPVHCPRSETGGLVSKELIFGLFFFLWRCRAILLRASTLASVELGSS